MKKVLFYPLAVIVLLACFSCSKKNTVTGRFDGFEGDSLQVQVFDFNNARTALQTLKVPVVNGDFAFDLADSTVRRVMISDPAAEGRPRGASLTYVPGERAEIGGRLDSVVVGGTKFYQDAKAYDDLCAEDQAGIKAISAEINAAAQDDAKRDSLLNIYGGFYEHITEITKDFIKSNPASLFGTTLLTRLIGKDGKDALEALENIPESVKEGVMKPVVDKARAGAEKTKARVEAAEFVKDGMQAPDFTLKNEKGEDFALSSIFNQGKYIILDFWGEWCYWCKKGIPDMKQLYKDAKGRIEILSIDCGDTEEVWKKAIADHELPWLHVYNPGEDKNDLAVTYAIQGYPTKVILNPDGTINKTVIGEEPEFYDYVKSLLK